MELVYNKMSHYYSEKQESELNLKKIKVDVFNKKLEFFSGNGVFSKDNLDVGSKLLIEKSFIEPDFHILDLGCGIGVVGISLKLEYPSIEILMTDINERALKLAMKNVNYHKLKIDVKKSNVYEKITKKFNAILSNPPQTAGKDICFKIIEDAPIYLEKNGLLQIVARHNKGGSTLKQKMIEVFGNVEEIAKSSGYRVYVSKKD